MTLSGLGGWIDGCILVCRCPLADSFCQVGFGGAILGRTDTRSKPRPLQAAGTWKHCQASQLYAWHSLITLVSQRSFVFVPLLTVSIHQPVLGACLYVSIISRKSETMRLRKRSPRRTKYISTWNKVEFIENDITYRGCWGGCMRWGNRE